MGPDAGSPRWGGHGRTGESGERRVTSGPAEGEASARCRRHPSGAGCRGRTAAGIAPGPPARPQTGGPRRRREGGVSRRSRPDSRGPPGAARPRAPGAHGSRSGGSVRCDRRRCRSSRCRPDTATRRIRPALSRASSDLVSALAEPPGPQVKAARHLGGASGSARSSAGGGAPSPQGPFVDERQDSDVQRVGVGSEAPRKSLKRRDSGCHARLARGLHPHSTSQDILTLTTTAGSFPLR